MKLFRATLVLWLIAILLGVSGEAGKSSHRTIERCFSPRVNLLITFSKQLSSTSSAALHDSGAKGFKMRSQTKFIKTWLYFCAIVLPRGVTTINSYLTLVRTSLCHTFWALTRLPVLNERSRMLLKAITFLLSVYDSRARVESLPWTDAITVDTSLEAESLTRAL